MGLIFDNLVDILGKVIPAAEGGENDPPQQQPPNPNPRSGRSVMEVIDRTQGQEARRQDPYPGIPKAPPPKQQYGVRRVDDTRIITNPDGTISTQRVPGRYTTNPQYVRVPIDNQGRQIPSPEPRPATRSALVDSALSRGGALPSTPNRLIPTNADRVEADARTRRDRMAMERSRERSAVPAAAPRAAAPKRKGTRKRPRVAAPAADVGGDAGGEVVSNNASNMTGPVTVRPGAPGQESQVIESGARTVGTSAPSGVAPSGMSETEANMASLLRTGLPRAKADALVKGGQMSDLRLPEVAPDAAPDAAPVTAAAVKPQPAFETIGGPRTYNKQQVQLVRDLGTGSVMVAQRADNPEYQRVYDQMTSIAQNQQALQAQLAQAPDDATRERLQNEIDANNIRIDELSYQLNSIPRETQTPIEGLGAAMAKDRDFAYQVQKEELTKQLYAALEDPEGQDDAATIRRRLAQLEYDYQDQKPKDTKRFGWKDQLLGAAGGALRGFATGGLGGAIGGAGAGLVGSIINPDFENQLWKPFRMRKYEEELAKATTAEQAALAQQKAAREMRLQDFNIQKTGAEASSALTKAQQDKLNANQIYKDWVAGVRGRRKMTRDMAERIFAATGVRVDFLLESQAPRKYTTQKEMGVTYKIDDTGEYSFVTDENGVIMVDETEMPVYVPLSNGKLVAVPAKEAYKTDFDIRKWNAETYNRRQEKLEDREWESQKIALEEGRAARNAAISAMQYVSEDKGLRDQAQRLNAEVTRMTGELTKLRTENADSMTAEIRSQINALVNDINKANVEISKILGQAVTASGKSIDLKAQFGLQPDGQGRYVPVIPRLPTPTVLDRATLTMGVPAPSK